MLYTSKQNFVDPLFPYFCMTKKNHPPNTHHPLKWPWPSRDGTLTPNFCSDFLGFFFSPSFRSWRIFVPRHFVVVGSVGGSGASSAALADSRNASVFVGCQKTTYWPTEPSSHFFSPSMKFSCRKINSFAPTFSFRKRIGRPYSPKWTCRQM